MFVASYIIFPGESTETAVDLQPLGSIPRNKLDIILAKLKGHKHLFEATTFRRSGAVVAGLHDFCILFCMKVPVSKLSLSTLANLLMTI
jgi:hypothetical protein